jgi:S1-C subfamily serine protease
MKNTDFQSRMLTILLAIIVGGGAGIVATVTTSRAIDDYAARLLDERKFSALAPIKLPTLPGTYEESLTKLRDSSSRSIGIFMPKSVDAFAQAAWLKESEQKGFGVVVSADGWLLTTTEAFPVALEEAKPDVWVNQERYVIEKTARDTTSPLVLLKLASASGLPAAGFADAKDMESGEALFALGAGDAELTPIALSNADHGIAFGSVKAESFITDWTLSEDIQSGTPLFSSSGELAGFSTGGGHAFPLHHSSGFVTDVVRTGSVRHPLLGAYVLDLSHVFNVSTDLRQGRNAGALVVPPVANGKAVIAGGPANKAGIVAGDIILDIDGDAVSSARSTAEILADYEPGEIANVRILRGGVSQVVPVTLGDEKDLLY